ncbi:uncharacterized protein LOC119674776 [Teleopsis dalmanni]|uniref:uncharacterized protein LOC119674776 n=1 Tax=Teleopsis dalmanni TaxID=139649 RepID=UPI0018CDA4F7|nr:uncharacterized protein LOC119674776 [Teleopsis dalmanni]
MSDALKSIYNWATDAGLSVNAEKTDTILFTRKYKVTAWTPPNLNGTLLPLKTQTKYLGVIVDSKLTWKPNVEERVKKATNALYACKRMPGSTWGLSPGLMYWCYTAIVRPILLYGILVWWTVVKKKTYIKPLEKVQRHAAMCITGAIRTTPTAALEVILNLPPIDIFAENMAAKTAERLRITGQLTRRSFGHNVVNQNATLDSDYMIPIMYPGATIKTVIENEGWKKGMVPKCNTINVFTDGSKMEVGVGAGIYCAELSIRMPFKLPNYCSVFQAEVFAVKKAAELVCRDETRNYCINFYVDSQAAIKAIKSYWSSSKNVLECKEAITRLACNRRLYNNTSAEKSIEQHPYFGVRMKFCSSAILKKPRLSTTIVATTGVVEGENCEVTGSCEKRTYFFTRSLNYTDGTVTSEKPFLFIID